MRLRWREIESDLKTRLARYDRRRRMPFWTRLEHRLNGAPDVPGWLGRSLLSLLFLAGVINSARGIRGSLDLAVAVVVLWALLLAIFHAGLLLSSEPGEAQRRGSWWLLPLPPDSIFRLYLGRVWKASLWLFGELLLVYGLAAATERSPVTAALGAICAAALGSAVYLAVVLLMISGKVSPGGVFTVVLGSVVASILIGEAWLVRVTQVGNPFGWVAVMWQEGWLQGSGRAWWGAVPTAILLATVPISVRMVRRRHHDGQYRAGSAQCLADRLGGKPSRSRRKTGSLDAAPGSLPLERLTSSIWDRPGLVERILLRLLTSRERDMVDLLHPAESGWSRPLWDLVSCFFVYLGANALVATQSLEELIQSTLNPGRWTEAVLVAVLTSVVLLVVMGMKTVVLFTRLGLPEPAIQSQRDAMAGYRSFRLFPTDFWEAAKVIAKIHAVLALLLMPLAVTLSFTPVYRLLTPGIRPESVLVAKGLMLLGCLAVLAPTLRLTPSLAEGWRYWRFALGKTVGISGLAALGGLWWLGSRTLRDLLLGAALVAASFGWVLGCGHLYRRGHGNDLRDYRPVRAR